MYATAHTRISSRYYVGQAAQAVHSLIFRFSRELLSAISEPWPSRENRTGNQTNKKRPNFTYIRPFSLATWHIIHYFAKVTNLTEYSTPICCRLHQNNSHVSPTQRNANHTTETTMRVKRYTSIFQLNTQRTPHSFGTHTTRTSGTHHSSKVLSNRT